MTHPMPILRGHRKLRLVLGMAGAVVLAACATLDPPPRSELQAQSLEHAQLPPSWRSGAGRGTGEVGDGWITTFGDPQLEALVAEAIAHNPDLAIAATRIEQADALVESAQAQLKPGIGLLAHASSKPLDDLVAMLSGAIIRVWWELDLWGRLRYSRNAALAERDAAGADFRYAQQSIAAATARAWFLAAATARQKKLSEEMAQGAAQLVSLAGDRLRVGAGSEQDVALARASEATYLDGARQIELAHRQALRALEVLLGRYPAAELKSRDDLGAFPAPVPVGLPLQVLERRPDLLAAEYRVAAAFNRVGEAKAARLPSLRLTANGGWVDKDPVNDAANDGDSTTASFGGQLIAPIYMGGALNAQVKLRTAEQKQAVAEYGRLALQAFGEVEDALDAETIFGERERLLRGALDDSRRALDLERTSYRVGKADLRAVTQSQLATHAAEIALLQVRREHLYRRVDLHLALGGGFDTSSAAPPEAGAPAGPEGVANTPR